MGLFCVNFHFRGTEKGAVEAALRRRGALQHCLLPPKQGWISVYEELASRQDEDRIHELIEGLSRDLQTAGIAFLVHDSDIARYWLFDDGRLVDEYNSCPDYFDDRAGDAGPSGGRADLVLPYCVPGWSREDLESALNSDAVFAEAIVEKLAEALGIDVERALTDYRDLADGDGPAGWGGFDDDSGPDADGPDGEGPDDFDDVRGGDAGDDTDGTARHILPFRSGLLGQLGGLFGAKPRSPSKDPRSVALVQSAANDDVEEIDRLIAAGVPVDGLAPASLPNTQALSGLGQLIAGGIPQLEMTPLLAAILHRRQQAVERLLAAGADPNQIHPVFGSPVHVATGAGQVAILTLLLGHGGHASSRNVQGQTPLEILKASRENLGRLAEVQAMAKSMGIRFPKIVDQLSASALPIEGWDACEHVLRTHESSSAT